MRRSCQVFGPDTDVGAIKAAVDQAPTGRRRVREGERLRDKQTESESESERGSAVPEGRGKLVAQAYLKNGGHSAVDHGQFSPDRYAFLFKPGTYEAGNMRRLFSLGGGRRDVEDIA